MQPDVTAAVSDFSQTITTHHNINKFDKFIRIFFAKREKKYTKNGKYRICRLCLVHMFYIECDSVVRRQFIGGLVLIYLRVSFIKSTEIE